MQLLPACQGDKYYDLAQKYLPNGTCGVVSFGLKGGREAAETFMKHLKLAAIETHVADARTCCLHPASSTHRQMTDAELDAAGVGAGPDPSELRSGKRAGSDRATSRRHWRTCNQEESVCPFKIPNDLPAAGILQQENIFVMTEDPGHRPRTSALWKFVLLNLMPTKIVTETQLGPAAGQHAPAGASWS